MPQHHEIERKFLVQKAPDGWRGFPHYTIEQGYFPVRGEVEFRLRRAKGVCLFTVKTGESQSRFEEEFELPEDRFKRLWRLTRGARLRKVRYRIPYLGKVIEMDVYAGPHRGLVTAEVEFENRKESCSFKAPEWLGRDITGQRRFSNAVLARSGSLT